MKKHNNLPSREQQPLEIYDRAIGNALDGYAYNGTLWIKAKEVFNTALTSDVRIDYALRAALDAASPDALDEIGPTEQRFWRTLGTEKLSSAMSTALDGYASTGGTWQAGMAKFSEVLHVSEEVPLERAVYAGLSSVSTDEHSSTEDEAWDRFYDSLSPKKEKSFNGRKYGVRIMGRVALSYGPRV